MVYIYFIKTQEITILFCFIVGDKGAIVEINAHESDVGALAVNCEGTLVASASTRGTIIRIFSAEDGNCI
jgi:hypothetical protein